MSTDGQRTKWRRNIAKKNRISRMHERYRQTDRRTDGRGHIARPKNFLFNFNLSFTFVNTGYYGLPCIYT